MKWRGAARAPGNASGERLRGARVDMLSNAYVLLGANVCRMATRHRFRTRSRIKLLNCLSIGDIIRHYYLLSLDFSLVKVVRFTIDGIL